MTDAANGNPEQVISIPDWLRNTPHTHTDVDTFAFDVIDPCVIAREMIADNNESQEALGSSSVAI